MLGSAAAVVAWPGGVHDEGDAAIRPVNHLIDGRIIVIRSHLGSAITGHSARDGAVVCCEADDIDPDRNTGWSVIATGLARLITDPGAISRLPAGTPALGSPADGPGHRHHPGNDHRIRLAGFCQ